MIEWVPWISDAFGLVLMCVEVWATRFNRRVFHDLPRHTRFAYIICTSVVGLLLVYGSLYPEYRLRSDLRIFGVPFMTAALQFRRGGWMDYTGFLTVPALLGNALVAFLLPQLFVLIYSCCVTKTQKHD